MPIDEAKQILNLGALEDLTRADIDKSFNQIFESNTVSRGGSFYLQSKIYRARESILVERGEWDEEQATGTQELNSGEVGEDDKSAKEESADTTKKSDQDKDSKSKQ